MRKLFSYLIVLSLVFMLFSSCSDARGKARVQKDFSTLEVTMVPDSQGCFIIRRQDGSVWYAEHDGISSESPSSDQVQLFGAYIKPPGEILVTLPIQKNN